MTLASPIARVAPPSPSLTVSHQGRKLSAQILLPGMRSGLRPLIALHGISRDTEALARHFRPEAERSGRIIVVPRFCATSWPNFQRPAGRIRPDRALLALLDALAANYPGFDQPVDLFGFSGGAQLAHRSAMLYPHRFADLHLGAAGWYCMPHSDLPYPYGLGPAPLQFEALRECTLAMLPRFLDRKITVYAGENDTARDPALRQNALLDEGQGLSRIDRARAYVSAVNIAARAHDIAPRASFIPLPGCDHDFPTCAQKAGLARLATGAIGSDAAI